MPIVSDRPERGFDSAMFEPANGPIHIVHVHGSVLRDNPASSAEELDAIERTNSGVLAKHLLATRDVLVVGHSGGNDSVVAALGTQDASGALYWCDMNPLPNNRVDQLLDRRHGHSAYVQLDRGGADALMTALHAALLDA